VSLYPAYSATIPRLLARQNDGPHTRSRRFEPLLTARDTIGSSVGMMTSAWGAEHYTLSWRLGGLARLIPRLRLQVSQVYSAILNQQFQ
jgi:hypothetical protein